MESVTKAYTSILPLWTKNSQLKSSFGFLLARGDEDLLPTSERWLPIWGDNNLNNGGGYKLMGIKTTYRLMLDGQGDNELCYNLRCWKMATHNGEIMSDKGDDDKMAFHYWEMIREMIENGLLPREDASHLGEMMEKMCVYRCE